MDLTIDILCTLSSLTKFCKLYDINVDNISLDNMNEIFKKYIDHDKTNIKSDETIYDIKINDIISVSYYPLSQKYIDYYDKQYITGKVIFIDAECDNLFLLELTDTNYVFKSLEREGCSFLGTSKGYEFIINKKNFSLNN